jgi:hypothetical protein
MFRARTRDAKIVAAISTLLLFQEAGYSRSESFAQHRNSVRTQFSLAAQDIDRCPDNSGARLNAACNQDDMSTEPWAEGEHSDLIAHAREQALEILQTPNPCAAWFQESDPDAAEVFSSLHYRLDRRGTSHVERVRGELDVTYFKHPWAAWSTESTGSDSTIYLNGNGAFFARQSRITDPAGGIRPPAWHRLKIGFYDGDTPEARVTILLHELGHIIGRLPADSNSWDGLSSRNTMEVLQHCKSQIDRTARKYSSINN